MEAPAHALLGEGFPLLPTADHPHWTVVLSGPEPRQFDRMRLHFSAPRRNPVWTGRR
jgi:hypothetical protein